MLSYIYGKTHMSADVLDGQKLLGMSHLEMNILNLTVFKMMITQTAKAMRLVFSP